MFSMFYAQGTTNGSARAGRGGLNTTHRLLARPATCAAASTSTAIRSDWTARLRMGPFSLDPTVLYQFGNEAVDRTGRLRYERRGRRAEVLARHRMPGSSTCVPASSSDRCSSKAWSCTARVTARRNNTLGTVRYFQPLTTDTGYLADWGTLLTSLGIDYLNALNEAAGRIAYPGASIGWDKYGRIRLAPRPPTPSPRSSSVMAGANVHWTRREGRSQRHGSRRVPASRRCSRVRTGRGTVTALCWHRAMALITWRFAPGLTWDNQFGYMFMGHGAGRASRTPHAAAQHQRPVHAHLSRPLHVLTRETAAASGPGGNPRARCLFTGFLPPPGRRRIVTLMRKALLGSALILGLAGPAAGAEYRLQVANLYRESFAHYFDGPHRHGLGRSGHGAPGTGAGLGAGPEWSHADRSHLPLRLGGSGRVIPGRQGDRRDQAGGGRAAVGRGGLGGQSG